MSAGVFISISVLSTQHFYLITLCARTSTLGGIVTPICLAVFS